ncbi:MAG: hypothetical protein CVU89_03930 [Firmicutes bacterium HGW-Firmicutes-14]|nr:MAG: hypothetical protein CVU89_03930 [Firmicutes bacterium HGW-Firmicutes-14]
MKLGKSVFMSFFVVLILSIGMYLYKPVSLEEISTVRGLTSYVRSFGTIMPLAAFAITVIQAIVPVIPFIILCSTNGILFGMGNGILLTWTATLTGATIMFFAARRFGWEIRDGQSEENSNFKYLKDLDGPKGFMAILALRLLPYFPAPLVNIASGIGKIGYVWFLLASAIGKLPFIVGYTFLGYSLLHRQNLALTAVLSILLILIPYLIAKKTKHRLAYRREEP